MYLMKSEYKKQLDELLGLCVKQGASDMHLSSERQLCFRINGRLAVYGENIYSREDLMLMAESIMDADQQENFQSKRTADIGYTTDEEQRFRINIYFEMGNPAMAIRYLDQSMASFKQLGLPSEIKDLAYLKSGLVLVTGATGSGKSSTLAVLIDEINRNRDCHILTVEDPVEFVHKPKNSLIHHREVGVDVPSYADAVRASLREDPDVIMVGEMRDLETMTASITAAETGHLVFSTLHTGEAVGAIERFIGYFSGPEQGVARHRIAMVLRAVIAQRLVPRKDQTGRWPVIEMLRVTTAVSNLILHSKTKQIYSMMESGANEGMWTVDQDLAGLVKTGKVEREVAKKLCNDPVGFQRLMNASVGDRR